MKEKFEVFFVGGANGFVDEKTLAEMIRQELNRGFVPTIEFHKDGSFVLNFFEVEAVAD